MAPLDAYSIHGCISKGGSHSRVYQATHLETGTVVAIKRIQIYDMHPTVRKEYETEVGVLQTLDHPNLIKYHEHFNQDNELYLVMTLATGGSLAHKIEEGRRSNSRIEESLLWRWLYDAAGALAYMHKRKILHRDVKPSHIYLGENGQAKLGNFGLSKAMTAQSQAFSCVGTPFYMSPEIVRGGGYSFASDVWSLGCCAYELATCYPPFHRADSDFYALGEAISSARYPALSPYEWSKEFIDIVTSILRVKPEQRPSAQHILDVAACKLVGKIQDFEILGTIGRGKFSEVHRSKWKVMNDQEVALKRVHIFEMESEARKECITEVNLLKSLAHCTIIKYLDSFLEASELVIVLELAPYGDLSDLFRQHKQDDQSFTELQIWALFFQVCDALYFMHSRRIMHRDIKPANMFLCAGGVVKLGDLGLGRYFSSNTYRAYSVVGTPFYMSPEVITNTEGYSFKSDIWSLGCVLYELAILTSPFACQKLNYYVLGNCIRSAQYPPLPEEVSPWVRSLATDMIQVVADRRPDIQSVFVRANEHFTNCPQPAAMEECLPDISGENATLHRQLTRAAIVAKVVVEREHVSQPPASVNDGWAAASCASPSEPCWSSPATSSPPQAHRGEQEGRGRSENRGRGYAQDGAGEQKRTGSRTKRKPSQRDGELSHREQPGTKTERRKNSVGAEQGRRNIRSSEKAQESRHSPDPFPSAGQCGNSSMGAASSRKAQTPPAHLPHVSGVNGIMSEGWKPVPSLGLPPLAPPHRDGPREAFTERSTGSRTAELGGPPQKRLEGDGASGYRGQPHSGRASVTPPNGSSSVGSVGGHRMRSPPSSLPLTGAVVAGESSCRHPRP